MALQFFFDECADEDVAKALVKVGVDVATVAGLQRKGLPDTEQFEYAKTVDRVIYSTDHDFLRIATYHLAQGISFPGLIFHAPGSRTKRQIIDSLELFSSVLDPPDMLNKVEFI